MHAAGGALWEKPSARERGRPPNPAGFPLYVTCSCSIDKREGEKGPNLKTGFSLSTPVSGAAQLCLSSSSCCIWHNFVGALGRAGAWQAPGKRLASRAEGGGRLSRCPP